MTTDPAWRASKRIASAIKNGHEPLQEIHILIVSWDKTHAIITNFLGSIKPLYSSCLYVRN